VAELHLKRDQSESLSELRLLRPNERPRRAHLDPRLNEIIGLLDNLDRYRANVIAMHLSSVIWITIAVLGCLAFARRARRLYCDAAQAGAHERPVDRRASRSRHKQRRLFAGLESLKLGRGGDLVVSDVLGLDPATVAGGRHELLENQLDPERVRKAGAGRHAVEKKRPRS
jgi:hypothetical protein